jgi:hypothetical protein
MGDCLDGEGAKKEEEEFARLLDHVCKGDVEPIPLCHGEFRVMALAKFAFAVDMAEEIAIGQTLGKEPLHRIFGRCVEIALVLIGCDAVDIGIVRGESDERARIDLNEAAGMEKCPRSREHF